MHLLTVEEYAAFLKEEFAGVDPKFVSSIVFERSELSDEDIRRVEQALDMGKLPSGFVDLLKEYDFGNLSLMNEQFGAEESGSLEWLLEYNDPNSYGFEDFIKGLKDNNLIIIANGDPFTILMDVKTEKIYAVDNETPVEERIPIANSFERFVEGMGTGFMAKRRKTTNEFLELARSEFGKDSMPFWQVAAQ